MNIGFAGLAAILIVAVAAYTGARTEYVTLASNLEPEQVTKIVEVFRKNKVTYTLTDDNRTLKVPLADRGNTQLMLAENDVAVGRKNLPGFELFQTNELMSNQWLQDVKYQRAITGELQKQLNAIDFVDYSYVLIRESKEELFSNEQRPSEAAVTLKLKRQPTKQEIKGILNLVAAAGGPTLDASHITITSTEGQVLHMPPESEYASIANSKLEHVAELEKRQEARIMDSLRELGIRGTVRVSAQVDFNTKKMKDEKVSDGTALSTLSTTTKNSTNEAQPQGAPGAFANVPEGNAAPGKGTTEESTSEDLSNYEPSRTTTETTTQPGDVLKYTVALVVESDREKTTAADGTVTETPKTMTPERKKFYENLVRGAVGEGQEPTVVTVDDFPFEVARMAEASAAQQGTSVTQSEWMGMAWTAGQIMMILVGFFFVRMFIRRAIEGPEDQMDVEEVAPIPEATREDLRRQDVSGEVARLSRDEPDMIVSLLRAWLIEEED